MILTIEQKNILAQISEILDKTVSEPIVPVPTETRREMLTINECLDTIKGLTSHTLRLIIARGEIPSFRTGEGRTGKILVPKAALLNYFDNIYNSTK